MFAADNIALNPDFQEIARTGYLSEVERKDFTSNSEKARKEINSWVERKTNSRIQDLLPQGMQTYFVISLYRQCASMLKISIFANSWIMQLSRRFCFFLLLWTIFILNNEKCIILFQNKE